VNAESSLARLLVALLAGLLIGLDRERAEQRKAHEEFAGVRTFPLVALSGCLPMLVGGAVGPWLLAVAFVAVTGLLLLSYRAKVTAGHIGATTEVAAVATFLIGVLAGAGELLTASATAVVVAVLLVAKPKLEGFSLAVTTEELAAALELAVISVIIYPLLPDRGFGPWEVLNPRDIWLVVVLVAGLSFVGFVAMRLAGERRGLAITGAVGGLVSSTAVTMAMADRSSEEAGLSRPAAAAAILASTVMPLRVAILAGAIDVGILPRLVPAMLAMAAAGAVAARAVARAEASEVVTAGSRIRNPFSLRHAVVFAGIYALVLLVARAAQEYVGSGGQFLTAALASVADVDAVTIAFTRLGPGDSLWRTSAAAITVAAVMNTLVKLGLGWARGSRAFRRSLGVSLAAMAAFGIAVGVWVWLR